MLKLALSQLRDQPRRYVSVLLAIVIGVTFLASALLVGSSSTASLRNSLGATYSRADLVIAPTAGGPLSTRGYDAMVGLADAAGTTAEPGPLQDVEGVAYAYPHVAATVGLLRPESMEGEGTWSDQSDFAIVSTMPQDPSLVPERLLAGEFPEPGSTTEITVDAQTASHFGLEVGSATRLVTSTEAGDEGREVTVTGLTERSQDLASVMAIQIRASEELAETMRSGAVATARAAADAAGDAAAEAGKAASTADAAAGAGDPRAEEAGEEARAAQDEAEEQAAASNDLVEKLSVRQATHVLVRLEPGADPELVASHIQALLQESGVEATVADPDEQSQGQVAAMAGSNVFLWVLMAFAAIALLVTALVIANTFSVLVAQRSRDLALQRALGASRRQVRGSVLAEAVLVGLAGSLLGIAGGMGSVYLLVTWGASLDGFGFLTFEAAPRDLIVSVAVGVLLTVLASSSAAVAATRVSPLEAMRPRQDAAVGNRAGVVRLVVGALLLLAGLAALFWGARDGDLAVAVAGGALSFVGILALTVLVVPALVFVVGLAARLFGVPGRMAQLNARRNPGRTAATASALLIGTTLVAMMLTGGRTAQVQMDAIFSAEYPVDVNVSLDAGASGLQSFPGAAEGGEDPEGGAGTPAPAGAGTSEGNKASGYLDAGAAATARDAAADVDGIEAAALLSYVGTAGTGDDASTAYAADPTELRSIVSALPADQPADRLGRPGTVLVPASVTADTLVVKGPQGSAEFEVVHSSASNISPVITLDDARALGWDAEAEATAPSMLWLKASGDQTLETLQALNTEVARATGVSQDKVGGTLAERLLFSVIVDAMLMIVTALLMVSVLIAVIGVANTLSLSTIERTRENSLMRALGLTRGGLRGMLALEAVLISGVAALIGCALGTFYGGMGSHTVFGPIAARYGQEIVWPTVPWAELALIVLVSVVAGLLASVAPSRRAARLSPVQGLAMA
ncbi:MAG: ABC transporter permease [Micrococcus sp.]|nr:ABC transporter permease [Micrococcus sp.]